MDRETYLNSLKAGDAIDTGAASKPTFVMRVGTDRLLVYWRHDADERGTETTWLARVDSVKVPAALKAEPGRIYGTRGGRLAIGLFDGRLHILSAAETIYTVAYNPAHWRLEAAAK